ncbi:MAG: Crp/Fnr family transcriptional regulator [Candidatus Krumholzibacteriia bacterium]
MTDSANKLYCSACEMRLQSALKDVRTNNLEAIDTTKACNSFKKGQVIFEQGSLPKGIFCIHDGKVKVYKTGDEGRDQIVRFAKNGDIMGYRSLISGERYSVSAAALEDSVVCFIPQQTFFEVLRSDEQFPMTVIRLLSGELQRAQEQIVNLAQKPVRERLAETLLILKEVYGTDNGDNATLNVKLSRDELASVVGTATETLVRTIADLKRENLIATDKKKIRILDVQGLIRAGNLHD